MFLELFIKLLSLLENMVASPQMAFFGKWSESHLRNDYLQIFNYLTYHVIEQGYVNSLSERSPAELSMALSKFRCRFGTSS